MSALVSIGIPTYNRPDRLRKCLDAVTRQTHTHLEIIISDNCSPDKQVEEIGLAYAAKDPRIRFIQQVENIGGENNFSFVYHEAKGEYFIWMADDDFFETNYIETCLNFLLQHPDYYHVSGLAIYLDGEKQVKTVGFPDINSNFPVIRVFHYFLHVSKNGIFYGLFKLFPKEEHPISNTIGSDWAFIGRQAYRGKMKVLSETSYSRSLDGVSSNRESMVNRWKLQGWRKKLFEVYAVQHVCRESFVQVKFPPLRWFYRLALAGLLIVKFLINAISKRVNPSYY